MTFIFWVFAPIAAALFGDKVGLADHAAPSMSP
jgi:hypothetical protein